MQLGTRQQPEIRQIRALSRNLGRRSNFNFRLYLQRFWNFTLLISIFSDALEEQQAPAAPKSRAQADMDLD